MMPAAYNTELGKMARVSMPEARATLRMTASVDKIGAFGLVGYF